MSATDDAVKALDDGRKDDALALLAAAAGALETGARPRDFFDLGLAWRRAGEMEKAEAALSRAAAMRQDVPLIFLRHGECLLELGRTPEARAAGGKALALQPKEAELLSDIAVLLHRAGDIENACVAYEACAALRPDWTFLFNNWAAAAMEQGRADEAVRISGLWLGRHPKDIEALAFRAIALHETGDDRAAELLDFDRFVQVHEVDLPDGYESMAAFNKSLEAHVLGLPDLATPEEGHPTYHDPNLRITGEILTGDKGPLAALEAAMHKAVRRYEETLGGDDGHPFIANMPASYRLAAWAAVLDRQGNQSQHIHEDGYLSGCYYVRIPPEVASQSGGDGEIAGGFEVGRPPDELFCTRPAQVRAIKPEEGMMVLFPAYMYHRTIPFKSTERRICIAFDVVPE